MKVRDIKVNGNIGAVGGWNVFFKGERDLHSAAGKGL